MTPRIIRRLASRASAALVNVSALIQAKRGDLPELYVTVASYAWGALERIAAEPERDHGPVFVGAMWHHDAPVPVWRVGDELLAGSWEQYAEEHRET